MEYDFSALECALNGECSGEKVGQCDVEIGSEYEDLVIKQNLYYIVAGIAIYYDDLALIEKNLLNYNTNGLAVILI